MMPTWEISLAVIILVRMAAVVSCRENAKRQPVVIRCSYLCHDGVFTCTHGLHDHQHMHKGHQASWEVQAGEAVELWNLSISPVIYVVMACHMVHAHCSPVKLPQRSWHTQVDGGWQGLKLNSGRRLLAAPPGKTNAVLSTSGPRVTSE